MEMLVVYDQAKKERVKKYDILFLKKIGLVLRETERQKKSLVYLTRIIFLFS